jgi:hypothetical protein
MTEINIGSTFVSNYANHELSFTVTRFVGDVVFAEAEPNNGWGITERPFSRSEALQKIGWAEIFAKAVERANSFWTDIAIGSVLHYHSGYGRMIRGIVVLDDESKTKKMQPLALIGEWSESELPHRSATGEVLEGTAVAGIRQARLIAPDPDTIWEAMTDTKKSYPMFNFLDDAEPSTFIAVDITLREATPLEIVDAEIEVVLNKVVDTVQSGYRVSLSDRIAELQTQLPAIEALVKRRKDLL